MAHRPNNAAMLTGRTKIAWWYWLHVSTRASHTLQLNTTWEPFQLPNVQLLSRGAQFYRAGKAGIASIWKGIESKYWLLCLTPVTPAAAALAKHTLLLLIWRTCIWGWLQMVRMRHLASFWLTSILKCFIMQHGARYCKCWSMWAALRQMSHLVKVQGDYSTAHM